MTGTSPAAPIVVGVDDSSPAQDAVKWAAEDAQGQHRPLRIVHGFIWPLMNVALGPPAGDPGGGGGLRAEAERLLIEAEASARSTAPDIAITTRLVTGAATQVLLDQARDAELVVLGNRGIGGFVGLLVGSVGVALAAHAPCPVVIARPRASSSTPPSSRRVVVGIDGSDTSLSALEFAFRAAAQRGLGLTALRSLELPLPVHPSVMDGLEEAEEAERQLLAEALEDQHQKFPEVEVHSTVVRTHPGHALVVESNGAELVVVGSRGRGGFKGMLLGSVSQAVLHHAECPVAVVRPHS
jgi:nucleotide-binding universal stress UspA family protein